MKKVMALVLVIYLSCMMTLTLAEDVVFTTDWYSVKLPEGNWQRMDDTEGRTYYYRDGNVMNGTVMFVTQDIEPDDAAFVTEEMTLDFYNDIISSLTSSAVDGKVDQEKSVVAGRPGVIFSYVQEESGLKINVIGNCVNIGGHILVVCYMHLIKPVVEIRDVLMELSDSVVYLGDIEEVSTEEGTVTPTQTASILDARTSKHTEDSNEKPNLNYYHFDEAKISFVIPNGWEQRPLTQERNFIKMKMSPADDKLATSIMFGCQDIWGMIPEELRKLWSLNSKEDLESIIDTDFLASVFDADPQDAQMVTYAGIQYGIGTMKQDTELGITIKLKYAMTIKDGLVIIFQMYDPGSMYNDIFETVLNSVNFD